jgi:hypothetical protein
MNFFILFDFDLVVSDLDRDSDLDLDRDSDLDRDFDLLPISLDIYFLAFLRVYIIMYNIIYI